ncbi:MAG: hydrogenase maturation protease, partial [Desulfohalobiaceae bacterium]
VVLGLGDLLSQDKGLGIYAVRDLYQDDWPQEVDFLHSMQKKPGEFELDGCEHLLVLDAWSTGQAPGTMHRCTMQELIRDRQALQASHIWEALTLAQLMGQSIDVLLMGLEPERTEWNLQLSPALQRAYPHFLSQVRQKMRELLQEMGVNAGDLPVAYAV